MKVSWIAKQLYYLCAINVSERQNVMTIFKLRHKTEINLTFALLGAFERSSLLRFIEDSENTAVHRATGFSPTWPHMFSATFVKISAQGQARSGHQVRSSDPTTK